MDVNPCSVGVRLGTETCHKLCYARKPGIKAVSTLSEHELQLLNLRVGTDLETICFHHEKLFLTHYSHYYGVSCCDPTKCHKKVVKSSLRIITLQQAISCISHSLIPGKALCSKCYYQLFQGPSEDQEENVSQDPTYIPSEEVCHESESVLQTTCGILEVSPIKKAKLSEKQRASYGKKKLDRLSQSIQKKLEDSLNVSIGEEEHETQETCCTLSEDYNKLIEELKDKMKQENITEQNKVAILSLVPKHWTIEKTAEEFNVSVHMVKKVRNLTREQGVLPHVGHKKGRQFDSNIHDLIQQFYDSDEISRMCPGRKDTISVKNKQTGIRQQYQKRLVLCNLKEAFEEFRKKYPEHKVGFSKFAELRPRWCVLAGSPGTHTVCVCTIHQNVKLMLSRFKSLGSTNQLLQMMVCDSNSENCMLGNCTNCPGIETVKVMLDSYSEIQELDQVIYKQWVSTDRSMLVTCVDTCDEFIEKLCDKLCHLRNHHYIAKQQSSFFKAQKESLQPGTCVLLGDFSENFSFIVQDEVQGFHWVNDQATLHPFVAYIADSHPISMCIVSDHMEHNTVAVHYFQQIVIEYLRGKYPDFKNILYFTDGAASQYKNKKNFTNLLFHKHDFNGIGAEWHFFATSHGKGACDGIGGTVKRLVAKASLQRPVEKQILNSKLLYEFACENIPGIQFFYVPSENIESHGNILQNRFKGSSAVPGTRGYHMFVPIDKYNIRVREVSTSPKFKDILIYHDIHSACSNVTFEDVKINSYVACVYEGKWWFGKIVEKSYNSQDYKITFLHPHGPAASFFWPTSVDICWVQHKNILSTVPEPMGGTWPKDLMKHIQMLFVSQQILY